MSPILLELPTPTGLRAIPPGNVAAVISAPGDPCLVTLADGVSLYCSTPIAELISRLQSLGAKLAVFRTVQGLHLAVLPSALTAIESSGEVGTVVTLFNGQRHRLQERFLDVLLRLQTS